MAKVKKRAVVITTAHKGVFFGYAANTSGSTIKATQVRMAVYWPAELKSVMGLAVTGPNSGSKISPAVPSMELRDITGVLEVTPEAEAAWLKAPWRL